MEQVKTEFGKTQLVEDELSVNEAISELKEYKLRNDNLIAVDSEGISLSRKGKLTVLIIATREKVYVFDVLKVGQSIFESGLREILEDSKYEKLMFDCRQDSDALWHQFNIKLAGVVDLQLLEVMQRCESHSDFSRSKSSTKRRFYRRRSQNTENIKKVYGYRNCLELYVKDEKMIAVKDKGVKLFTSNTLAWTKRPLPEKLIRYCAVDTMGMFKLYEAFKSMLSISEKARLKIASDKYTDYYREKKERVFNEYETNSYLPLDVIPEKGTQSFPYAGTTCTKCDRKFPQEEFSVTQLRKGEQKCRVCKEIKRVNDVQKNREDNWARDEEYENSIYISDGEGEFCFL